MRCSVARRKLIDRELGAGRAHASAQLDRHLEACAACAAEAREGLRIAGELALLRRDAPFDVDVVARVRADLASANRPARTLPAIDRRAVAWITAGILAVFSTLAWGVGNVTALSQGLGESWTVVAAFGRVGVLLFSAVGRTLETAGALGFRWISAFAGSISERMAFGPSLEFATLGAAAVMTMLTLLVLARDFRRSHSLPTKGT